MKKVKATIMTIMLMAAVLAVLGVADAAPVLVGSVTDGIEAPSRVALDGQGNIYVSETTKNRVTKFNAQGVRIGSVSVPRPYGVAVSATGTLYVCSLQVPSRANNYTDTSDVRIYSSSLAAIGSLGASTGGFGGAPVDIEIDGSGNLYVVDAKNGVVKVFNADGVFQYSIGSGYLRPEWTKGIAINDSANEVYVADAIKTSVQGNMVDAPRITVFTKNGSFLRSFGKYGTEAGCMMTTVEIALDKAGLLYVSDRGNNVVHVLNPADGSPVGEGGIYTPVSLPPDGVAVGRNSLLYVAWAPTSSKGRVDIYGLAGFVTMKTSTATLAFEARQFGGNPSAQKVTITNAGEGTLTWSASTAQNWIMLGEQAAVAPAGSADLAVGVDTSKVTAGVHQGVVTVASDFGQTTEIGVTFTVLQPLSLNISNGSPSFSVKPGSTPVSQTVTIGIDGGTSTWSLGTAGMPSWLTASPTTGGSTPTAVTFTANPAGLAAGTTYTATVPVTADGVVANGTITVTMTIAAQSRISVTTNQENASFTITGPANFTGTGADWGTETAPAGDYTVTFGNVAGFRKPYSQTKTLAETGSITFNGTYVSFADLAAKKNIVVAKGAAATNDSQVKAFKNNGLPTALDMLAFEKMRSGASVAVGDVDLDGAADLIVGAGSGPNNPATVRVFRVADKALIAEFVPFGTLNGARVAAGDLDGDGKAEVIVSDNIGAIAVYAFANGKMASTGITLAGTAAAAVDTAYDGKPEIVTVSADSTRLWNIDLAKGTAALAAEFPLSGASVAAADIDGDGGEEIIVGASSTANGQAPVTIVRKDGSLTKVRIFEKNGVNVAAADLDGDGSAEIIVGAAEGDVRGSMGKMEKRRDPVQVYGADGSQKFTIKPFDTAGTGVSLAVGDLGL